VLGSWKIARLFGIDVRLHWTFLLLLAVLMSGANAASAVFVMLVAFGSVLLHELGHSLVAQRFGVRVLDITFWPLGGMARMSEIPEEPRIEGWIAIAGPAVNFALAALAAPLVAAAFLLSAPERLTTALAAFLGINLVLGTFNLAPAFPMDGGRLLRAFLARRVDYVRATELAVKVGRGVALCMLALTVALSLFSSTTLCALPLVALFIWFAGGRELFAVRLRHGVLGSRFGMGAPAAASAGVPVPAPARPSTAPAAEGPRRPETWEAAPPAAGRSGFSEETLRQLERFHGPLRRPAGEQPEA
jgi:Zn-dependent protease